MTYMYCASCGLHVRARSGATEIEICPRCLAREATVAPLLMRRARGLTPAARAMPKAAGPGIGNPY
ncbi:MAG: hypothetical protein ACR2IP_10635 [Solirubrobacteraceae bacterium]